MRPDDVNVADRVTGVIRFNFFNLLVDSDNLPTTKSDVTETDARADRLQKRTLHLHIMHSIKVTIN